MDEFKQHCQDEGFKAEHYFKFHPDPHLSALAVEMIADRYQLSQAETDVQLGELVTRLLYEMKLTVVNMQIEEFEADLKDAQKNNDIDRQMQLLARQPELLKTRNDICKILGNRVINL